jgi:hypothetical protein
MSVVFLVLMVTLHLVGLAGLATSNLKIMFYNKKYTVTRNNTRNIHTFSMIEIPIYTYVHMQIKTLPIARLKEKIDKWNNM